MPSPHGRFSNFHKRFDNVFIHPVGTILLAGIGLVATLGTGGPVLTAIGCGFAAFSAWSTRHQDMAKEIVKKNQNDVLPPDHPVSRMVKRLAKKAGLKNPPVVIASPTLRADNSNVPYIGTNGTTASSVILVSPHIERQMTASELEAVLAHEITHIKNADTKMDMTHNHIMSLPLHALAFSFMITAGALMGVFPPLAPAAAIVATSSIVGAAMLRAAISRARERRADEGAAALSQNPWALSSALGRIVELQLGRLKSLNKEAPGPVGKLMIRLFRSHPKTKWRCAALEEMGARMLKDDPSLETIRQRTTAEARAFTLIQKQLSQQEPPRQKKPRNDDDFPQFRRLSALPAENPLSRKPLPFNQAAGEQDNRPPAPEEFKAAGGGRERPRNPGLS